MYQILGSEVFPAFSFLNFAIPIMDDTYLTIVSPSEGIYKEKGSKFLAFAYPAGSQEEIKNILDGIRKEHHEARHHCYAWMLGKERTNWRANDDGEPSGTGGRPILGQINSHNLTNILIVVSRYFGGTLLGVSGLINAYKTAAADAIGNAVVIERKLIEIYELRFPYLSINDVMRILKEEGASQSAQDFAADCRMRVGFRAASRERIMARFARVDGLVATYIETQ